MMAKTFVKEFYLYHRWLCIWKGMHKTFWSWMLHKIKYLFKKFQ